VSIIHKLASDLCVSPVTEQPVLERPSFREVSQ